MIERAALVAFRRSQGQPEGVGHLLNGVARPVRPKQKASVGLAHVLDLGPKARGVGFGVILPPGFERAPRGNSILVLVFPGLGISLVVAFAEGEAVEELVACDDPHVALECAWVAQSILLGVRNERQQHFLAEVVPLTSEVPRAQLPEHSRHQTVHLQNGCAVAREEAFLDLGPVLSGHRHPPTVAEPAPSRNATPGLLRKKVLGG